MNPQPAQPGLTETLAPERGAGRNIRAPWLAWTLCLLCMVLALAGPVFGVFNGRSAREIFVSEGIITIAVPVVTFAVVGALIASRRPGNPIGWIFCAAALLQGLLIFAEEYATYTLITRPGTLPLGPEASWLKEWIWAPGIGLILVFLPLLFPNGRPPTRRWWWVGWLGGLSIGLISVLGAVLFWPDRGPVLMRHGGYAEYVVAPTWALVTDFAAFPLMVVAGLGAVVSLFVRFRRAREEERQQIKWFASACALTLGFSFVFEVVPADGPLEAVLVLLGILVFPVIPVATGIAIFKHRLYDIDVIINRALVYGALTACVAGIYVLVVGYLGALLRTEGSLAISLVATGIVAVLFQPLRERLQKLVNRLTYGERDDPYAAVSRLGERLGNALEPHAVLPTIVETVRESLKLPYTAIALPHGGGFEVAASSGERVSADPLVLPLHYGGETVGRLMLDPRAGEAGFSPADRRLLDGLARHAGVAVHGVRVMADLRRSREGLVLAREEERRRLRRDLHDELAPTLAALGLSAATVGELISTDPKRAASANDRLRAAIRATVGDVRRLVYDLRPPALDELGLIGAIKERAARLEVEAGDLRVTVEAPDELPSLPAALEVACYRIVQEALTNISRHAQASSCIVRLAYPGGQALTVEVTDNGVGMPGTPRGGIGLSSMRERAAELGGTCEISPAMTSGTRVFARLPLTGEEPGFGPQASDESRNPKAKSDA